MSMNLTPEKFSCEPEYLLAGTGIRVTTAVKKAAAALKAGAPVKLDSSGKAAPVAKADGTTGLYGITTEDFKSGEDAVIYLTGEFFARPAGTGNWRDRRFARSGVPRHWHFPEVRKGGKRYA